MLQQEFEKLTGVEITPEQYEVINGMYMCSDNQTKQEFCKNFMEMGLMAHVPTWSHGAGTATAATATARTRPPA